MLRDTLRSIAGLAEVDTVEAVVVVSTDATLTRQMLTEGLEIIDSLTLQIVSPVAPATIAAMRNLGAGTVKSQYVAFVDADIQLSENWLTVMYRLAAENPGTVLFAAVQQPDQHNGILHRIRSVLSRRNTGSQVRSLPGANLFLSTGTFNRSEQFDAQLVSCEDSIFSTSLLQFGKLELTDEAGFVHLGEDRNFAELLRKEIFRGQSNLMTLRLNSDLISELPSLLAPVLFMIGMVLLLPALLLGSSGVVLLALICLFLPPVAYSLRLKRAALKPAVTYAESFLFYTVYFLGRGLGMVIGPLKRGLRKA